jgi:hypothetical protein
MVAFTSSVRLRERCARAQAAMNSSIACLRSGTLRKEIARWPPLGCAEQAERAFPITGCAAFPKDHPHTTRMAINASSFAVRFLDDL